MRFPNLIDPRLLIAAEKNLPTSSISNADGSYHDNQLDRYMSQPQTHTMRVELPRWPRRPATFLMMIALMMASCARSKGYAQTTTATARITLVFFAEQSLRDGEWDALFDALKKDMRTEGARTSPLAPDTEFLRGDKIEAGLHVNQSISVYLHGNCSLVPLVRSSASGALGWVRRVHGHIEPFIHVDCTQIAQELGPVAFGMNRSRRDVVMSEALARVVLHEWIHVATQNPGHEKHGVAKAQFDPADLLADDQELRRAPQLFKRRWNDL